MLSVRLREKGRTRIEERKYSQLLNNDLIFVIKEHKERGGCGVKRVFFFFNLFLLGDIWTSYLEADGNDPEEETSLVKEKRLL